MRTSVSCPPSKAGAGFTLLELVVVLALLGLATALVAPQGFRTIQTWRRATDVDATLGALSALGADARTAGRRLAFDAGPLPPGAIKGAPEGWTVVLDEPLVIQANGACGSTSGELREGSYARRFALEGPFCRIALDAPRVQAPAPAPAR
jgi:prepilin-type N-terminal cleavage/methylation domain-containing protein